MTEVLNCGGGHRTRLRDCLFYFGVPPGHVYKGGGREAGGQEGRAMGGVLLGLLVQVGFGPPFSFLPPEGKEGGEKEKEGGGCAPTPSPIWFGHGEARATLWPFFPLSTKTQ